MARSGSVRRTIALALGALLTLALPRLPALARVAPAHPAIVATAIPFETARVEGTAGGPATIVWAAPGMRRVRIFATTDASGSTGLRAIGGGGGSGTLAVPALPPAPRWYFRLVPDRGMPLVIAAHALGFANAPNLRDIGGYRTTDGRWVRTGLLYRSDQMNRLTESEVDRLRALAIVEVADLRTEAERTREPDRVPAGARHAVMDVMGTPGGAPASVVAPGAQGDIMATLRAASARQGAAAAMLGANRAFVSNPGARTAYTALFRDVAGLARGALVYHCTAGKDRTGWASAMLLLALGVPRQTVMDDYLRSNALLAEKNARMLAGLEAQGRTPAELAQARRMFSVEPDWLAAALDEVDTRYGGIDAYLTRGLGITPVELAALRARYLVGTAYAG